MSKEVKTPELEEYDLDGFGTGMKVKHLIKLLNNLVAEVGGDALEYMVYLEQCTEGDKKFKRGYQKWDIVRYKDYPDDEEPDEFFAVLGGIGTVEKDKVITINVNY